jgi:2-methylcitrate dehydratase PrpD
MIAAPPAVTARVAAFAVEPVALPPAVVAIGKQTILNALALAAGSAHEPTLEIAYGVVAALGTPPEATVVGRGVRVAAPWAALLNGMAVHVEDFDDTHLRTVLHPGAPIVPAAFAAAELYGASGRALLEAVAVGMEIAMRVGNALGVSHFDRGWHVTGTMGHLGAAAAAGRIAGLDAAQMCDAIGIAALQSAGLTSANGTMVKSFHPGKAAFDAIEAVWLARAGIEAAPRALEGKRGLGALLSDAPAWHEVFDGLGTTWEAPTNAFKPYACGIVSHPIIDAGIELRAYFASAGDIASIDVRCHPVVLDVMGKVEPRNGLETKFSAYHCAAVGFLDAAAGPRQFSDAYAVDPGVVALRRKVKVETTRDVPRGAAHLTARGVDGRVVEIEIVNATGSIERPMTDAQLAAKAVLVAGEGIRPSLALVARLEDVADCGELVAALPVVAG